MSTRDPHARPHRDDLDQSDVSSLRLAPRREEDDEVGDVRGGGDATKAPPSLSQAQRHPLEGASSGTSWDDPDEL